MFVWKSIGQHDWGTQVVANVTVSGGMPPYTYQWAGSSAGISLSNSASIIYAPVTRVVRPVLSIVYAPPSSIVILWPDPSAGFELESSTNLQPTAWAPVTNLVAISNSLRTVTLDLTLNKQGTFA
jgi:hypothetical protein